MHRNPMPGGTRHRAIARCLAIVAVSVLAGCDALWKPLDSVPPAVATSQATRSLAVEYTVRPLTPPFNGRVTLDLRQFGEFKVRLTRFERIAKNEFIWRGRLAGTPGGRVAFSVVNGRLVGEIVTSNGRIISIRYVTGRTAIVEELDATKIPLEEATGRVEIDVYAGRFGRIEAHAELIEDGAPVELPPATDPKQPDQLQSDPAIDVLKDIDLLVLYTHGAAGYLYDPDAMKAKINQAISDTNEAYLNSGIGQQVRLAHHEQTGYTEQATIGLDWGALKDRSHPAFNTVDELIATHHADVVVLLTKPALENESCGVASQMHRVRKSFCSKAVAVVPISCATTKYSFAHELGHVMGADHNSEGGTFNPPYAHSRGYVNPAGSWHTIMSYPTGPCALPACQRILHWSNSDPSVGFSENDPGEQGTPSPEPTGNADADNSKSLNLTANTVAAFSETCVASEDTDNRY